MSGKAWDDLAFGSSGQSGTAENRQHVRVSLNVRGHVRTAPTGDWLPCLIVNVSSGGVQIAFSDSESLMSLKASQCPLIRFRIGTEYELQATMVWEGLFDRQYKAGMEWNCPTESQMDRLRVELMRVAVQRRRKR